MKSFELSGRLGKGKFVFIDDEDHERVTKNKWYWDGHYVIRYLRPSEGSSIRLHRFIMNAQKGQVVDHMDRNSLNNQKSNLRFCSHQENLRNKAQHIKAKSGLKGVAVTKSKKRPYTAYIHIKGKKKYLGHFSNKFDAARAYNKAALIYHGVFAYLNPIASRQ